MINILFYLIIGVVIYYFIKGLIKEEDLTPVYFLAGAVVIYFILGLLSFL